MSAPRIVRQSMQNIVLDTNCLIMAVSAKGEYSRVDVINIDDFLRELTV